MILLVEDDPEVLAVHRVMLEQLNYRVLTAVTGQEALALYQTHRAEIALLLSDMVLPDMEGGTLFNALKRENPALKIIVISGYAPGEKGASLLDQDVTAWYEKPITFEALSKAVRQALPAACHPGRWG